MATSTKTHDYMGRALINDDPGTTDPVRDFVGRNTTSTADYVGQLLQDDPAGSVSGVITDADDDSPIEGATVTVGGHTDTTNSDGEYTVGTLQPATYAVLVTADGYDDAVLEGVVVEPGEDVADVDIDLDAS